MNYDNNFHVYSKNQWGKHCITMFPIYIYTCIGILYCFAFYMKSVYNFHLYVDLYNFHLYVDLYNFHLYVDLFNMVMPFHFIATFI